MSIEWCFGGVWPDAGTDAADIGEAIYDARYPVGSAERERRRLIHRPLVRGAGVIHEEQEGEASFQSAIVPVDFNVRWSVDGWFPGGDHFFAGTSPRTPRESQALTYARQREEGTEPGWDWEYEFFPFHLSALVNGPTDRDDWSIQQEYFWLARNVLIPRGWASFMYFWLGDPDDVWGTVPGHPDVVRLPDDFRSQESDAWSLFDRPAAETS